MSSALVDTGEQRSPKKTPDKTAPPASTGDTPMEAAAVMHTAPIVAAAPKDVPMSADTALVSRNDVMTSVPGWMRSTA